MLTYPAFTEPVNGTITFDSANNSYIVRAKKIVHRCASEDAALEFCARTNIVIQSAKDVLVR